MIGSLWFNSFSAGGGGAAADYELISTTVLGSSAASVTFSGLGTSAAAYKHLQIRYAARTDRGAGADSDNVRYRFNSDSGSNYSVHYLYGTGSSVASGAETSQTKGLVGNATATNAPASSFSVGIFDVLDFSSSSKNKTTRSLSGFVHAVREITLDSSAWLSTSAITQIDLSPQLGSNFVTGSRFSLYGLKG